MNGPSIDALDAYAAQADARATLDECVGGDLPTTDACVYTDLDWTLAELAAVEAEAARIDARKRELREVVASFMAETDAHVVERPLAKVMMVAGSPRISYDHKALDVLCGANIELARILGPHRRETTTAPACRITWTKNGGAQ